MKRKWLEVGIILLFIGTSIVPAIAQDTNALSSPTLNSFFGLHSRIDVTWDWNQTNEPLSPNGTPRTIPLNVTYWCTKGSFFGHLILLYYFLTKQYINISLELEDIPGWCTAHLSNPYFLFPITGASSTQVTSLVIAVNKYAPATPPFWVTLKTSVDDVRGHLGFLTLIEGFEISQPVIFQVEYRLCIAVIPEYTYIETSPGTPVIDPITVTNLGNGVTTISADLIEVPQNWIVSIDPPQIELPVNESRIMNLSITPPIDFYGIETINLSFTPKKYPYEPGDEGPPTYVTITVNVTP